MTASGSVRNGALVLVLSNLVVFAGTGLTESLHAVDLILRGQTAVGMHLGDGSVHRLGELL
jgi:hypothetical protein